MLHLGLEQEILAWLPASGSYRQVTAEEGRVLGFVQSPDRRTIVYVRAGRLVREPERRPRCARCHCEGSIWPPWRSVPAVPIAGDVVELRVEAPAGDRARLRLDSGAGR